MLDIKRVSFVGNEVHIDGKPIDKLKTYKVTSYPRHIDINDPNINNKRSFSSEGDAKRCALVLSGIHGEPSILQANIFPDEVFILRVSDIIVAANADPNNNSEPIVMCRIYYNTTGTTGSSAASKPVSSEIVEVDLKHEKFITRKEMNFANKSEIIDKIWKAIAK